DRAPPTASPYSALQICTSPFSAATCECAFPLGLQSSSDPDSARVVSKTSHTLSTESPSSHLHPCNRPIFRLIRVLAASKAARQSRILFRRNSSARPPPS